MKHKTPIKQRIRGWIPKESIKISVQTSRTLSIFMIVIMAVLIVPIFYLGLQATNYLGILWPIIYLAMVLVVRYIIHKTGFPMPSPRAQRIEVTVRRIRIIIASGLVTAFGIGLTARLILGPLSAYFWIPFIILTIVGALIGDGLWKIFQKRKLEGDAK
jgi:hypothetical protein